MAQVFKKPYELADHMVEHINQSSDAFNRYAQLKDFYNIEEGDEGRQIVSDLDRSVGEFDPTTNTFYADEYYDEVEKGESEDLDRFKKRLTALGYTPTQIEGTLKSYFRK